MSIALMEALEMTPGLSPSNRCVLMWLCYRANIDGHAWPSKESIARACHLSTRQVQRAFSALCKAGHIRNAGMGQHGTVRFLVTPRTISLAGQRGGDTTVQMHHHVSGPNEPGETPRCKGGDTVVQGGDTVVATCTTLSPKERRQEDYLRGEHMNALSPIGEQTATASLEGQTAASSFQQERAERRAVEKPKAQVALPPAKETPERRAERAKQFAAILARSRGETVSA